MDREMLVARDLNRENRYELMPYLVKDGKRHPFAVICPGGGYRKVASYVEGHPFALRLNEMGFHAFVVYYRVREKARFPAPLDDLARGIGEIFDHADQWLLDTRGYSLWGSSAGGHLAGSFGTESMGYAKYGLPKPGAMVLVYPVVTMGDKTHAGSRENFLGENPTPKEMEQTSIHLQVTGYYPPTFLWWGDADASVPPDNSRILLSALERNGVPCQHREYPGVGHGVGLGEGLVCEGWFDEAVKFWERYRS